MLCRSREVELFDLFDEKDQQNQKKMKKCDAKTLLTLNVSETTPVYYLLRPGEAMAELTLQQLRTQVSDSDAKQCIVGNGSFPSPNPNLWKIAIQSFVEQLRTAEQHRQKCVIFRDVWGSTKGPADLLSNEWTHKPERVRVIITILVLRPRLLAY